MFGFVGKLVLRAIFSACPIFDLGRHKKLRQPKVHRSSVIEISRRRQERVNDLNMHLSLFWKFVDDSTASEIVPKGGSSNAQDIVDSVYKWSQENSRYT